jgi:hypothetical protein
VIGKAKPTTEALRHGEQPNIEGRIAGIAAIAVIARNRENQDSRGGAKTRSSGGDDRTIHFFAKITRVFGSCDPAILVQCFHCSERGDRLMYGLFVVGFCSSGSRAMTAIPAIKKESTLSMLP